jgi:hypothetical protein
MIHQYLNQCGEDASHKSDGWRREIMRLHKAITGKELWAGPSKLVRVDKKVIRINAPQPETGRKSLTQGEIARWPHSVKGVKLGKLGDQLLKRTNRLPKAS